MQTLRMVRSWVVEVEASGDSCGVDGEGVLAGTSRSKNCGETAGTDRRRGRARETARLSPPSFRAAGTARNLGAGFLASIGVTPCPDRVGCRREPRAQITARVLVA